MRYKVSFAAGFAAGYVLGARAGRERYDQIMRQLRGLREDPSVQGTAGVLRAQASSVVDSARRVVNDTAGRAGSESPDPVGSSPYPSATGVTGTGMPDIASAPGDAESTQRF